MPYSEVQTPDTTARPLDRAPAPQLYPPALIRYDLASISAGPRSASVCPRSPVPLRRRPHRGSCITSTSVESARTKRRRALDRFPRRARSPSSSVTARARGQRQCRAGHASSFRLIDPAAPASGERDPKNRRHASAVGVEEHRYYDDGAARGRAPPNARARAGAQQREERPDHAFIRAGCKDGGARELPPAFCSWMSTATRSRRGQWLGTSARPLACSFPARCELSLPRPPSSSCTESRGDRMCIFSYESHHRLTSGTPSS